VKINQGRQCRSIRREKRIERGEENSPSTKTVDRAKKEGEKKKTPPTGNIEIDRHNQERVGRKEKACGEQRRNSNSAKLIEKKKKRSQNPSKTPPNVLKTGW